MDFIGTVKEDRCKPISHNKLIYISQHQRVSHPRLICWLVFHCKNCHAQHRVLQSVTLKPWSPSLAQVFLEHHRFNTKESCVKKPWASGWINVRKGFNRISPLLFQLFIDCITWMKKILAHVKYNFFLNVFLYYYIIIIFSISKFVS